MKIYIAGSLKEKETCREYAYKLNELGDVHITSTWLRHIGEHFDPLTDKDTCLEFAQEDLDDIDSADLVVYVSGETVSPGKNIELGYCIANKKPILFVGAIRSVFHHWRNIAHFDHFEDLLNFIKISKGVLPAFTS